MSLVALVDHEDRAVVFFASLQSQPRCSDGLSVKSIVGWNNLFKVRN